MGGIVLLTCISRPQLAMRCDLGCLDGSIINAMLFYQLLFLIGFQLFPSGMYHNSRSLDVK